LNGKIRNNKLRLTIIILIVVLSIGSIVISLGFLTSEKYIDVPEITSQYEKLEIYKNELEKINQQNQKILSELENQIKNSDDVHLDQINEEINVIKQVIEENTAELEQVITKLSQIESKP
jgi:ABC-type xylose transport system substrate-binding protein